jgi:rod shape-determining protein MreC
MEHTPPPFFKRGPAPLARLAFFASLSIALLVLDARFRYTDGLRSVLALVAYPLQQAAMAPILLAESVGRLFASQAALRAENEALRTNLVAALHHAQRYQAAEAETAQLRRLIGAAQRDENRSMPAEILYSGRDPFAQKVIIDRGSTSGVRPGSPVVDDAGVVGQVTRVHSLVSEVTLLTDKDQLVPVQVVRNGLRAVAFGGGLNGLIELRYMSASADIRNGDRLVTSGIDGTYPAGFPVGTVVRAERDSALAFARIVCEPAAGVGRGRYVLVLSSEMKLPPYPAAADESKDGRADKARRARRKDGGGGTR